MPARLGKDADPLWVGRSKRKGKQERQRPEKYLYNRRVTGAPNFELEMGTILKEEVR